MKQTVLRRQMMPVTGRVILVLGLAVLACWAGRSALYSRGTKKLPPVPDAASQRHYLELARSEHGIPPAWQPLHSYTFDNPADLRTFRICEGEWKIDGGKLLATRGAAENYRTLLIAPCPAGPSRIEFDAVLSPRPDGRIGDIYLRFNADPATGSSARGYGMMVARYYNQDTVCYKLNQPIARTEWSPIISGKRHHIAAEWTAVHLRLFVDDRVVIDAWDRDKPIAPDPQKWLGLAVYDTPLAIDNLVISVPKTTGS